MRNRIRNILVKAAVSVYSRSSRAARSSALLLSDDRKKGAVAIVWALVDKDEEVLEQLKERHDTLRHFKTVVVVGWSLQFDQLRQYGYYYESVPSLHDVKKYSYYGQWKTYIARRISRIRRCYAPDFEIILGRDPNTIYSKLEILENVEIREES